MLLVILSPAVHSSESSNKRCVTAKLILRLLFIKLLTHNDCCQEGLSKNNPPKISIFKQKRISKNVSDILPKPFFSSLFHLYYLSHHQKFSFSGTLKKYFWFLSPSNCCMSMFSSCEVTVASWILLQINNIRCRWKRKSNPETKQLCILTPPQVQSGVSMNLQLYELKISSHSRNVVLNVFKPFHLRIISALYFANLVFPFISPAGVSRTSGLCSPSQLEMLIICQLNRKGLKLQRFYSDNRCSRTEHLFRGVTVIAR